MNIIILGAASVGEQLARYLVTAGHAVTLVDHPSEELNAIGSRLDLRVIEGNPCSPATLRSAGAQNAELLVAVTPDDEVNITACSVAAFLFNIPKKIARIRSQEYLQDASDLFGQGGIPIDHIISPEHIVTDNVLELINLPGAQAVASFANGRLIVAQAFCLAGGKLIGKKFSDFASFDSVACLLAVYRRGKLIPQRDFDNKHFTIGDEIIFCAQKNRALSQLTSLLPIVRGGSKITIAGGTHIADELARRLSEHYEVKLIEPDAQRSRRLAKRLADTNVKVYNADPVNVDFMLEEYLLNADIFVAASAVDETNIMSSLVLEHLHKVRTMVVIQAEGYYTLARSIKGEIDTIIYPKDATLSALLSTIKQDGVENMHIFRRGNAVVLELKLNGNKRSSKVIGRSIADLALNASTSLGLVLRGNIPLYPAADLVLEPDDVILVYLDDPQQIRKTVKYFRPHAFWIKPW